MKIEDSVCVVTGAASGLGWATAHRLAMLGAKVGWMDLKEPEVPDDVRGHCQSLAVDVTDAAGLEQAFAGIAASLGIPRILVHCAGILGPAQVAKRSKDGHVRARDLETFSRVLDVNIVGTFNALRLFSQWVVTLPPLEGGERGVAVCTASVAADEALSGQAAYGASKGAVTAMMLPFAREMAPWGVRAMSISPGVFDTGMYSVIPPETRASLDADTPFPSRPGQPEEFARLAEAIILNPMLNGSGIRIDGATRMQEPVKKGG